MLTFVVCKLPAKLGDNYVRGVTTKIYSIFKEHPAKGIAFRQLDGGEMPYDLTYNKNGCIIHIKVIFYL